MSKISVGYTLYEEIKPNNNNEDKAVLNNQPSTKLENMHKNQVQFKPLKTVIHFF